MNKKNIGKTLEFVKNKVYAGIVGLNNQSPVDVCFGKDTLFFNGVTNQEMALKYWEVDQKAFGDDCAPKCLKLDTVILGGYGVGLFTKDENNEDYMPFAFMDLHFKGDGKFSCSGLGITPEFQGKGLSKYLIAGGLYLTSAQELYIPAQKSNTVAIKTWNGLDLKTIHEGQILHEKDDTVIYLAKNCQEFAKQYV